MTTLIPSALPPIGPSPARNPFARPKLPSAGSFTRTTLLPSHVSPKKTLLGSVTTPADRPSANAKTTGSVGKDRKSWRLLWRGGLEVGESGYRLEGIMFYAMLAFPSTPSVLAANINPFDLISPPRTTTLNVTSPFALPSADTDLCLSLESMRGRKYLQVRGLTDLPGDEILEGDTDESGVQIPQAPLLAGYLTSVLCRTGKLSAQGRTLNAIIIGLGDEGVDSHQNTSLLVYGQRQSAEDDSQPGSRKSSLKLCVARRKAPAPPPSVRKVRPGDPLPRAPLFFPSRSFSKKLSHRPLSRTTSTASIYAPPVLQHSVSAPVPIIRSHSSGDQTSSTHLQPASVSGRTPGRRGEKRKRPQAEEDEKKRRSGKIVVDRDRERSSSRQVKADPDADGDEDIFGKRPPAKGAISFELPLANKSDPAELGNGEGRGDEPPSTAKKRPRVPQQVLDNKASIRKQALLLSEASGYTRDHELFKEIFSMVTKGTYFAFRAEMESGPLCKLEVQRIVGVHLGMYLPKPNFPSQSSGDETREELDDKLEILRSIKEENEDEGASGSEDTLVDIRDIKPKGEF